LATVPVLDGASDKMTKQIGFAHLGAGITEDMAEGIYR
jgi:hypothetical protein